MEVDYTWEVFKDCMHRLALIYVLAAVICIKYGQRSPNVGFLGEFVD